MADYPAEKTLRDLTPTLIAAITTIVLQTAENRAKSAEEKELQHLLYQAALRETAPIIGDDPEFVEILPEDVLYRKLAAHVAATHPGLRETVCVKFKYCEKKANWGREVDSAGAILAFALTVFADLGTTCGLGTLLFMMSRGFFDELCNC